MLTIQGWTGYPAESFSRMGNWETTYPDAGYQGNNRPDTVYPIKYPACALSNTEYPARLDTEFKIRSDTV